MPPNPERPHAFPLTVYYEDTDLGGVVYHANYLKFIERARSHWVRALGIDQNAMRAQGLVFVVHRVEADFLAPARLDDALVVETIPHAGTRARLVLDQRVTRGETLLFRALVTLVCMDAGGKPRRLPAAIGNISETISGNA